MRKTEEIKLKKLIADNFNNGINKKDLLESLRAFINETYYTYEDTPTIEQRLSQLDNILNSRLPFIQRWSSVLVERKGDHFVIEWSRPKRTNTHPYETKLIPIKDLDEIISRNLERLNKSIRSYK
jgi:hypothetical protein